MNSDGDSLVNNPGETGKNAATTDLREGVRLRLAELMRKEGLTAVKFAEIMEVQPSGISHLLSGRNLPNFEFISRIPQRFPTVNIEWLINGTGEIYKNTHPKAPPRVTNVTCESSAEKNTDVTPSLFSENTPVKSSVFSSERDESMKKNVPHTLEESLNYSDVGKHTLSAAEQDSLITNVTTMPETALPMPKASGVSKNRKIDRVIIFYQDGSFDEYQN